MREKIAVIVAKDRQTFSEQEFLQEKIVSALERRPDLDVTVIPHLYDLAPDGPGIRFLRALRGDVIVLSWLYPRSVYWVLDAHGVRGRLGRTSSHREEEAGERPASREVPDRTIWCFDLRKYRQAEPCLAEIDRLVASKVLAAAQGGADGAMKVVEEKTRPRWYPVIDRDRCGECQECLNFCLFGVFGLDQDDSVVIEQPDACRNGCPACARVCPSGAIMFPQHADPGIAGDASAAGGLKLDLSQLFAGVDPLKVAAAERQKALARQDKQKAASPPNDKAGKNGNGAKKDGSLDELIDGVEELEL
jgi:NAD-dependent dihydropyrimidine dehydrogenase PreA subunit